MNGSIIATLAADCFCGVGRPFFLTEVIFDPATWDVFGSDGVIVPSFIGSNRWIRSACFG